MQDINSSVNFKLYQNINTTSKHELELKRESWV
jgi:hypothetical protein